jgi:HSP20 family protein
MKELRSNESGFADSIESAFRRFIAPFGGEIDTSPLRMRLDISETPEAFVVKADLPGVQKEDIGVRIHGNVVQIDAEVKREKQAQGGDRVLRSERYQGSISRSFSLAQDVDETQVEARYDQGVLTLKLPKKAQDPSRKIQIQ